MSNKTQFSILGFSILCFMLITSCDSSNNFEAKLKDTLKKNPDIVFQVIEERPEKFMSVVQSAAQKHQLELAKRRKKEEEQALEAAFKNPLTPKLRDDESFRGAEDAPITLVEYSDFECGYCARGSVVVNELMSKYPGKIRFVYKHLPLDFHPQALSAAKYYEAIRLQSQALAFKFHDELFSNQKGVRDGKKFFTKVAQKLNVNMSKLAKDLDSNKVLHRIAQDQKEAEKFSMQGTPGFVLNGIPIRGAYPTEYFVAVIEKLQKKGKLTL